MAAGCFANRLASRAVSVGCRETSWVLVYLVPRVRFCAPSVAVGLSWAVWCRGNCGRGCTIVYFRRGLWCRNGGCVGVSAVEGAG